MTTEIQIDGDEVVALTQALVRLRTVNEPATGSNELAAAYLVADTMREFGWHPTIDEVAPGRPNVVAIVEGGGGPGRTLCFCGHTDVVTEGVSASWTVDPYGAEIRDGRLWGRGSADMKGGLAAMIIAVRAVQQAGSFAGRIVVAALADEEGLMLGAKRFAATSLAREIDGVIVGEPEAGEVCPMSKGAMRIQINFTGVMAHGAMPHQGCNPIPVAAAVAELAAHLDQQLQRDHGEHPQLGLPYVTPTVLRAGDLDQINVIPARATLCLDVRTVPGVDHADVLAEIRAMCDDATFETGVSAEVELIDDRPPVDTDVDHPVVRALMQAHEKITGVTAVIGGVPGATDGTILTRDADLATVVYGPGGKWIAHQADEWVAIDDLVTSARVFAEAARLFLTTDDHEVTT